MTYKGKSNNLPFLFNDRLMDPFTIKPIDAEGIIANAKECGGRILVVEDHYPEVSCHFFFLCLVVTMYILYNYIIGNLARRYF